MRSFLDEQELTVSSTPTVLHQSSYAPELSLAKRCNVTNLSVIAVAMPL